jgi:hypothetical protein
LSAEVVALRQQLQAIYASYSWRVTYPLRLGLDALRFFKKFLLLILRRAWSVFNAPFRFALAKAIGFVLARPAIREFLHARLVKFPWLYWKLYKFACDRGIINSFSIPPVPEVYDPVGFSDYPGELSPRAMRIYLDLKRAVAKRREHG